MGRCGGRRANGGLATAVPWIILFGGAFAPAVAAEQMDANLPRAVAETLAAVRDCMARNPPPWPETWQHEYLDTIREMIAARPDDPYYASRLKILREGFEPYWKTIMKNPDRPHFEVRQAEIRWYVESLMDVNLPGEEGTSQLRRQYENLANHAASGLAAQFSFLDPNRVQEAKADYLAECYRRIDAPLLPIFMTPLSAAQMERIQERWHDLRYARVDLWRQFGGGRTSPGASSGREHPDYRLTRGSLDQWEAQIWALAATTPEYFRAAIANDRKTQRQQMAAASRARSREFRLNNAVLQTEYLSFLLRALLETAHEESSEPPQRQDAATEGR